MENIENDIETVRQWLSQILHGDINCDIPEDLRCAINADAAFARLIRHLPSNAQKQFDLSKCEDASAFHRMLRSKHPHIHLNPKKYDITPGLLRDIEDYKVKIVDPTINW
jgi:hypothetical protein